MAIRVVRLGTPRRKGEGPRIAYTPTGLLDAKLLEEALRRIRARDA